MDQFDINREMNAAAGDAADAAMERLEADKEKMRERNGRLIKLDLGHYFDPQDAWVLFKQGSQYRQLRCDLLGQDLAEAEVEALAPTQGFRAVKGGLYWNEVTRHLYVKGGASYALYDIQPLPESP